MEVLKREKHPTTKITSSVNSSSGTIALLGTSADPPTYGHEALLKGLLTIFPRVVTWASNNPCKKHGTSLKNRYQLLNALVNDIDDERLELIQELSSPWTITTLEKASTIWPEEQLIFVIGSDLSEQIPTWEKPKLVLEKARIGIAPRTGWPINENHLNTLKSLGGKVDLLPLTIPEISSSLIRTKPDPSQIPKSILPIIFEKNLYGLKQIPK